MFYSKYIFLSLDNLTLALSTKRTQKILREFPSPGLLNKTKKNAKTTGDSTDDQSSHQLF